MWANISRRGPVSSSTSRLLRQSLLTPSRSPSLSASVSATVLRNTTSSLTPARCFHASVARALTSSSRLGADSSAIATPGTYTEFAQLASDGLMAPSLSKGIQAMGLVTMTSVQTQTINKALEGSDMYVLAQRYGALRRRGSLFLTEF